MLIFVLFFIHDMFLMTDADRSDAYFQWVDL